MVCWWTVGRIVWGIVVLTTILQVPNRILSVPPRRLLTVESCCFTSLAMGWDCVAGLADASDA